MKNRLEKILSDVAVDILEKLAFIFAFPNGEKETGQQEPVVVASVAFNGFFSGALIMRISAKVLPELAANMLGSDEEEMTLDQQWDALRETINVICGNILPTIAGEQEVFNIDPPQILAQDGTEKCHNERKPASIARLALGEGSCDLLLFIDDPIPLELQRIEHESEL